MDKKVKVTTYYSFPNDSYNITAELNDGKFRRFDFRESGEFPSTTLTCSSLNGLKILKKAIDEFITEIEAGPKEG